MGKGGARACGLSTGIEPRVRAMQPTTRLRIDLAAVMKATSERSVPSISTKGSRNCEGFN